MKDGIERRAFIKKTAQVAASAAVTAGMALSDGAAQEPRDVASALPTRTLGKTGLELPILGFGGAAVVEGWGSPLSYKKRVELVQYAYERGIRYFDTGGNYLESQAILGEGLKGVRDDVCLVTKIETTKPVEVRPAFEKSLKELETDHIDILEIHGTPGLEQMSVQRAMEVHAEILKLRDEGMVKHIGFSAHSYFDKALALIESAGFEMCMLSHGYILRGHDQRFSPRMIELRDQCLAKAHEAGMGIAAMKVVGAGVLGAWAGYIVPELDEDRWRRLPGAAIRWALQDDRVHLLVIGMRLKEEIDANIAILSHDATFTPDDQVLLDEYCAKALAREPLKSMRVD